MPRINVIKCDKHPTVTLSLNEERVTIPDHGEADVPDHFLPLLDNSHIEYELVAPVAGPTEGAEGAGGIEGDLPPEITESEEERAAREEKEALDAKKAALLALLDLSVPKVKEKLAGLSKDDLAALLAAEKAGKTRASLITALEEALNPKE